MKHAHEIEFDQTNLLAVLWIKLKMALLFREILSGLMSNKDAEYTICEIPMANNKAFPEEEKIAFSRYV